MSRPTTTLRHGARRLATVAVAGAVALTTALVPSSASAWDDDELPDYGRPWSIVSPLDLPETLAGLAKIADSCPAPALPEPQDANGESGYRMPVRIKLGNAAMLAGFTEEAAHHGQGVPFTSVSGLRGWVVAWVSLPAMTLSVDPDDVTMCTGWSALGSAWYGNPEDENQMEQNASDAKREKLLSPLGDTYTPIPGTIQGYLLEPGDPGDVEMQIKGLVASKVKAAVTGVNPDGSLEVEQTLDLDGDLAAVNIISNRETFACQVGLSPTATTSPKTLRAPDDSLKFGGKRVGVPPAPDKDYLPNKALTGAVEGGTATVGANRFGIDLSGGAPVCRVGLVQALYGFNPEGLTTAFELGASPFGSTKPFPIAEGLADLSVDLTVDKIGLPKGLPEGYGFR